MLGFYWFEEIVKKDAENFEKMYWKNFKKVYENFEKTSGKIWKV